MADSVKEKGKGKGEPEGKHLLKRTKSYKCPYSPSCFECPKKDCVVSNRIVTRVNILPGEYKEEE